MINSLTIENMIHYFSMAQKKTVINIPFNYVPRPYQYPVWEAFEKGRMQMNVDDTSVEGFKRYFLLLHHRRSGKDKTCLNIMIKEMARKVGVYYYVFPEFAQGKRAIWEGIGKDGFKYINHFPEGYMDGKPNETELKIKFKNGSIFQIVGVSEIDRIMGTNPVGIVLSEYALQKPSGWEFLSPIILENKGWVIFNSTPRGKNHLYKMWNIAIQHPETWFTQKCTIEDTGVLTKEDMETERSMGRSEEFIRQEYFVDFTAAIEGAYYADVYYKAEKDGRFCDIPYDPKYPVYTVWDLGAGDAMAIGFFQVVDGWLNMIDYVEGGGKGFPYFAKVLKEKEYIYGKHFAPHDIKHTEIGTGKTRLESAREWGLRFEDIPNIGVQNGIDAARMLFSKLKVDKTKCAWWLELIPQYTKEYDDDNKIFHDRPLHNFASHGADVLRYTAIVFDKMNMQIKKNVVFRPVWTGFNRR